ncbi:MAG TPA: dTDP-4-amino-4,6-dideoxy-D-galactose acyltransferase, partial [Leclercia adecarboxylata]|nr:dTDP-4-amino-4,6-dideoxy-D-galactose acyltransferase [Leclercia adecarboxylata]
MSQLRGALQPLDWESQFFALSTAIVRLSEDAPLLAADDLAAWQRLQAKIPAT